MESKEAKELRLELIEQQAEKKTFAHHSGKLTCSNAVDYLVNTTGAHWLINRIAGHQTPEIQQIRQQTWRLVHSKGEGVLLLFDDEDQPALIRQEIRGIEFILEDIRLILQNKLLFLVIEPEID